MDPDVLAVAIRPLPWRVVSWSCVHSSAARPRNLPTPFTVPLLKPGFPRKQQLAGEPSQQLIRSFRCTIAVVDPFRELFPHSMLTTNVSTAFTPKMRRAHQRPLSRAYASWSTKHTAATVPPETGRSPCSVLFLRGPCLCVRGLDQSFYLKLCPHVCLLACVLASLVA